MDTAGDECAQPESALDDVQDGGFKGMVAAGERFDLLGICFEFGREGKAWRIG